MGGKGPVAIFFSQQLTLGDKMNFSHKTQNINLPNFSFCEGIWIRNVAGLFLIRWQFSKSNWLKKQKKSDSLIDKWKKRLFKILPYNWFFLLSPSLIFENFSSLIALLTPIHFSPFFRFQKRFTSLSGISLCFVLTNGVIS